MQRLWFTCPALALALAAHSLTQQINETLQPDDDSNAAAATVGRNYLAGQDDW